MVRRGANADSGAPLRPRRPVVPAADPDRVVFDRARRVRRLVVQAWSAPKHPAPIQTMAAPRGPVSDADAVPPADQRAAGRRRSGDALRRDLLRGLLGAHVTWSTRDSSSASSPSCWSATGSTPSSASCRSTTRIGGCRASCRSSTPPAGWRWRSRLTLDRTASASCGRRACSIRPARCAAPGRWPRCSASCSRSSVLRGGNGSARSRSPSPGSPRFT